MSSRNDRDADRPQDDLELRRPRNRAGAISLVVLAGLFVTSFFRPPNPFFSVVIAGVALALLAAIAIGAWRRRDRLSGGR